MSDLSDTGYSYLSLGENCLSDGVLKRHGLKSFATPYSHGRSNIEYILQMESDGFAKLIDNESNSYETQYGSPVVRSKFYAKAINKYEKSCSNGFEFTHHDVIENEQHREAFARRIDRLLNIGKQGGVFFLYHHRFCKDTDNKLLIKNLNDLRDIYSKRGARADVAMFTQQIITDTAARKLEYEVVEGIHVFTFFTEKVWGGNDPELLWARCDEDLITQMIDKIKSISGWVASD